MQSVIRVIRSRRIRWSARVARVGDKRNAYRILVGKREGKGPLGSSRSRREDNIKMGLKAIGWEGVEGLV
jgi:hypothetical protein